MFTFSIPWAPEYSEKEKCKLEKLYRKLNYIVYVEFKCLCLWVCSWRRMYLPQNVPASSLEMIKVQTIKQII